MRQDQFAEHLTNLIAACGKTDEQVATAMGYTKPGIVAMFKTGMTRVPLVKVPDLAIAVGTDPADLLKRALEVYSPELLATIRRCMKGSLGKEAFVENILSEAGSRATG